MEKTIKKPVEEKPTVGKADRRINAILSVVLGVLCVAWIYPIVMIFFNSLKTERAITTSRAFELPTAGTFVGLKNYIYGIQEMDFLSSFWYSLVITVSSVVLILLCCSMCAWFITRVNGKLSKLMYGLCMFSMVVPFQMVMFTLAKTADSLKLNNPYNICIIYLGFGAGLAVFMFTGFMKSMPVEIEEAAMIDGCNPLQIFFRVVCPILKPTMISTAILETMWVWNDYLLPYLVLDRTKYMTIPIHIQYLKGSYGTVDLGATMALILLSIIPVIVFYLLFQWSGAVKNGSMAYFCSDVLGADWYMSILSILGAVPMAIAAAFVVPLANKFSKQKLTLAGLALGVVGGVIAGLGGNNLVVVGIGIALKCLGSSPACYLILAMLADVIDHVEYKHGIRTDGLTMSIYSSLMVAATPIGGAIIQALNGMLDAGTAASVNYIWIETIAYAVCAVLMIFFGVERNLKAEQQEIANRVSK